VVAAREASRKQAAADEAAFPALAEAAEEFFAVASAADDVVAKLEGADFGLEAIGERFVVGGKTADKVAIADVHFGDEFFDAVNGDDEIEGAEGFVEVKLATARDVEKRSGREVRADVLAWQERALVEFALVEGHAAAADGLAPEALEFFDFLGVDHRAEFVLRQRVVVVRDEDGMSEANALDDGKIHVEEFGQQ